MAERHEAAGESEPDVASPPPPEASGAALSLALRKTGGKDKALNEQTRAFLEEQTAVLRLQKEHLHEQRELQLSRLRWGRFSDRMKAGLQLMTGVVALVIALGLGGAIWDAMHSDSVVVDAFESPPTLAAKGLNGTVVASGLLDELHRLQDQTRVAQAKRGVRDAWSGDIKVEVPETGVSIGEAMRDLRRWLGHETHVAGDLVETDAGLKLTVRGDGFQAKSFTGSAGDLEKLTTQAAEYVYGEAEPYLAGSYLEGVGRDAEAVQLIQEKYARAKPSERPRLLNIWGNGVSDLGQIEAAYEKYREAVRLDPTFWIGFNNILQSQWALGREEDLWRTGKAFEARAGRGKPGQKASETYFEDLDTVTWNLSAALAGLVADTEAHGGVGSSIAQDGPNIADMHARMHDASGAELALQTSANLAGDPWVAGMTHFVHGWIAIDRGDGAAAVREMEAFAKAYQSPSISFEVPGYVCWLAKAYELDGRLDEAEAAAVAGGHYVDCRRFHADILDRRGDWAGAQKSYADAVAVAPDLPAAHYSWGLALARRGDLAGAEAKFVAANARGPHWADPLKAWGDALAAQHRYGLAESRYAEAAKYAPKWLALHLAWGNALRADGKPREAIAQYRAVMEAAGHG
jgi:tetratricopeptide (TPR) repeat protein